jgi:nucleoside-diphosphate-sugar epimerase
MARPHRILITGAGGFIGSHVTELLLRERSSRSCAGAMQRPGRYRVPAQIPYNLTTGLEVRLTDITDFFPHPGPRHWVVAPSSYLATDGGGTLNLLESSQDRKVAGVVLASMSEVCGTAL